MNSSGVEFLRIISKLRTRNEITFFACLCPPYNGNHAFLCHGHVVMAKKKMYRKVWCNCKVVVLLIKPISFLTFLLLSPSSDLKVYFDKPSAHHHPLEALNHFCVYSRHWVNLCPLSSNPGHVVLPGTPEHPGTPKNPEHHIKPGIPPPQKTRNTPQKTRNTPPKKAWNTPQNTKKSAKSKKINK